MVGYTACHSDALFGGVAPNDLWCIPQDIVVNLTHPSNWDRTQQGRNVVACHEMGHTFGLRHINASSCMEDAQVDLEIFLPSDGLIEELRASAPTERAVFFLRTKADAPRFFRLVNDNQGLIREFDGTSHARVQPKAASLARSTACPLSSYSHSSERSFDDVRWAKCLGLR